MGVRLQIFLFTILMFLLFAVFVAAYFVFFAPRFEMQRQYELFGEVAAATGNLETEANRLLYNDIIIQQSKFGEAADRYTKSRTAMGTVVSLKKQNEVFSDSISSVDHLYDQNSLLISGVQDGLSDLVERIDGPAPENGWTLDSLIFESTASLRISKGPLAEKARLLAADIHVLGEYLATTRQTVEQRSRAVNQEIKRIEKRTNLFIGIVAALAVLVSLVIAFRIAASIIKTNERSKEDLKRSRNEVMETLEKLSLAQNRLVLSEKMSALGNLAAGIAHELNSPLGAIVSANSSVNGYLSERLVPTVRFLGGLKGDELAVLLSILSTSKPQSPAIDLGPNTAEVKAAGERLKAMGLSPDRTLAELAAEHDFAGLTDTMPALFSMPRRTEILTFARDHFAAIRMLDVISLAAAQASEVVSALRQYLNNTEEDEFREVDVERSIEMVLMLIQNKIKYGITIEKHFCGAKILGSAQKLGQVWMNLISNAVHAMNQKGTLTLSSKIENGLLKVIIGDNGPGIPPDIQGRIFEPFFTTKRFGEGLGLGLDICRRIVDAHRGTIDFESNPGNTQFIVSLPLGGPSEERT